MDKEIITLNFMILRDDAEKSPIHYDEATFKVTGLNISKKDDEDIPFTIEYEDLDFTINRAEYDGRFGSFTSNSLDKYEIFERVVNAYLREEDSNKLRFDYEDNFDNEDKSWNVFDTIQNAFPKNENGLREKLPRILGDEVRSYSLDFATKGYTYYSYYDEPLMLGKQDNTVISDMEFFVEQALGESVAKYLNGQTEPLYIGENVKAWIDEEGKDFFIENYLDEQEQER